MTAAGNLKVPSAVIRRPGRLEISDISLAGAHLQRKKEEMFSIGWGQHVPFYITESYLRKG